MKAWVVATLGPAPEVLHLQDRPDLTPGPGELVVEVAACGLNFSDLLMCRGDYQEAPPLPFTPGTEIAGTVVRSGPDTRHRPGTRVVGRALLPDGGLAEQARIADEAAHVLPESVELVTAAAMHVTYQTAWFGLHHRARVQPADVVLVHAAAGGTGSAALQLALAARAEVIAVAGGSHKADRCRQMGAHWALDHRTDDVRAAVLDITDGRGADVVFDTVGGPSLETARRCVAFEGRVVLVGFASGEHPLLPATHIFVKNYTVLGLQWPLYEYRRPELVAEVHEHLMGLHAAGSIDPLIDRTQPLERASDALAALESGSTSGKLVIKPTPHG